MLVSNESTSSSSSSSTTTTTEVEEKENQSRSVLVINCYGVGGCGFTIGPGLAYDVLSNYIVPFINNNSKNS